MSSFTITAASEQVALDKKGNANAAFTVTNTTNRPVRGTPSLKPLGSTAEGWLSLAGGGTRNFSAEESQNFTVQVAVPEGTPPGRYSFRLNVSNEANPDEDFTEGPAVAFTVAEAPVVVNGGTKFPWWILIVLGVVVVGGAGAMIALWPKKVPVPNVVDQRLEEASNILAEANLPIEVTEWVTTGTNPVGAVVRQEPPAEERVKKGTPVKVAVEKEQERLKVPDLVGVPFKNLRDLTASLALDFVEGEKRFTGKKDPGVIVDMAPKANSMVAPGTRVTLFVEGESVVVPNVSQSKPLKDAVNAVLSSKLAVGSIDQKVTLNEQQLDKVIDQTPKAGQRVAPSTAVTLMVGVKAQRPKREFLEKVRPQISLLTNQALFRTFDGPISPVPPR